VIGFVAWALPLWVFFFFFFDVNEIFINKIYS